MNSKKQIPKNPSIEAWIIEDNESYRNNLVKLIDQARGMKCTGAYSACEDALHELREELPPHIILLDIGLPGMDGIEGIRRIKAIAPEAHIVIITVYDDSDKIFSAICAGAAGYLLKTSSEEKILEAIRETLDGGSPLNAQIATKVLAMFKKINPPINDYGLTPRERTVLDFAADGFTKKRIAEEMLVSHHTIDAQLRSIYEKLQVHSRAGAVAKAIKERLLK